MGRRRRKVKRNQNIQVVPQPTKTPLSVDYILRRSGFTIHRRKDGLPVLWKKDDSTYSQEEIIERYLSSEEVWQAEYCMMVQESVNKDVDCSKVKELESHT